MSRLPPPARLNYLRLAMALLLGFAIIGAAGLCVWYVRTNYVDKQHLLSWNLFTALAGGVICGSFAIAARICLKEIKKRRSPPPATD
jgi:hypothetical protein